MPVNMQQISKELFTFQIVLPNNPLKWLNCYVIRPQEGRCLLIDTGFHCEESIAALLEGIEELNLDLANTDVLITHLHADHSGNASLLEGKGATILMPQVDYERLNDAKPERGDASYFVTHGISEENFLAMFDGNPINRYITDDFSARLLHEGDVLHYGTFALEVICVPGHTEGNIMLYDRKKQLMFTGDHVLFDITPNISAWFSDRDVLRDYLESLEKVEGLPVRLALPAHRHVGSQTFAERIQALKEHHRARLAETQRVVEQHSGATAFETAGYCTWRIKAKSWADFPPTQKWFAIGEALAHLRYLVNDGSIVMRHENGQDHYYPVA